MKHALLRKLLLLVIVNYSLNIAQAQTYVSGGIYANTTWTKANSPYIVTNTVVVFPTCTLTIEPGVVVKFEDSTTRQLEIRQSTLIAIGNSVDSITFTSNSANPFPGICGGIYLNQSVSAHFSYCNFRYAAYGMRATSTTAIKYFVDHCVFSRNAFGIGDGYGVVVDSSVFNDNTREGAIRCKKISNSLALNNTSYGLWADSILNCISNYNRVGMFGQKLIINSTANYNSVTGLNSWGKIENCTADYNQHGIIIQPLGNLVFVLNSTSKHNSIGIKSSWLNGYAGGALINNCIIEWNDSIGVYLQNQDTLTNSSVRNNGVGIIGPVAGKISKNIIEENRMGVYHSSSTNVIACNRICNNDSLEFSFGTTGTTNVMNNFWCTTDSALIAAGINDGYDDVSLGLVTFMPIDTSHCYFTACHLTVSATAANATCSTCNDGSATALPSFGYSPFTYQWNTLPIQTTQTAVGLGAGTYTVCISDDNGCTACANVFVDDTLGCSGFSATIQSARVSCNSCNDGSASIVPVGGIAPYVYTWYTSPLQTTAAIQNLAPGTYVACVVDSIGCTFCDSVVIDSASCAGFSVSAQATRVTCDTCGDGTATATVIGGTSPFTYSWNGTPPQSGSVAVSLYPRDYIVCVTDINSCVVCDTVSVDSFICTGFSVSVYSSDVSCVSCADGAAQVNVSGGAAPYSYTWYTSPLQTTPTATGLPQGVYPVCVTDTYGCIACDTVTVSVGNCSAYFNLYPDTVPHTYYAINMASGNGALTYLWNWGDGTTDTGAFPSHTYATAGLYAICLSITDAAGCTNTHCNNFYLQRNTSSMVYVNVVDALPTSIQTVIENPQFEIFPNPANDVVTISIDESSIGSVVHVSDITGRKLMAVQLTTYNLLLNTSAFASGVYFVTVTDSEGRSGTKKLVIHK